MQNSISKKTWNSMKKLLKKGAQINAKTHQKSMPKLVTKRIRKIIKNHVSLKGKIIDIHWKNNSFLWFRRKVACANGKGIKKHQKWDQNPSGNRWQIDTKNMLEKGMQKSWNNMNKWAKKRGGINKKHIKKEVHKSMRKKTGKTKIFRQGPWCPDRLPTRYTSCTKRTYKGHYK